MYFGEARILLENVIQQCRAGAVDWTRASAEGNEALRDLRERQVNPRPDKTSSRSQQLSTPTPIPLESILARGNQ